MMVVEKLVTGGKKLDAIFMSVEKTHDKTDRTVEWDVLKVYGVGGNVLDD